MGRLISSDVVVAVIDMDAIYVKEYFRIKKNAILTFKCPESSFEFIGF